MLSICSDCIPFKGQKIVFCKYLTSYWSDNIRGAYRIVDFTMLYKKVPIQFLSKTNSLSNNALLHFGAKHILHFLYSIRSEPMRIT